MQGEHEGRKIEHKLFKELFQFLLDSKFFESYKTKNAGNLSIHADDIFLFDCTRLEKDLGLDLWDTSEWKDVKTVAQTMLTHMKEVNSMLLLSNCKLSALKAFATMLSLNEDDDSASGGGLPEQVISSCIELICQFLHEATELLFPFTDAGKDVFDFLTAQAELLLFFVRFVQRRLSLSSSILLIKTIGSSLKTLKDVKPTFGDIKPTTKLLLMVLLTCINSIDKESEVSDVYFLRLLPTLCNFIEPVEYCTLSLSTIDLLLKRFSSSTTWFPIIQKHLHLQNIAKKLHDQNYSSSVPVILKFLLTFARVREGAEMLTNTRFLSSLRVLLENGNEFEKAENDKHEHIWGLGLAVLSMIVYSLRDGSSSSSDIVDYVISCFIVEKPDLISYCLNAPNFSPDTDRKKRARGQQKQMSLTALKETQHALVLICMLAKHHNLWSKTMKEMDSHLREMSIRLLAFISRGPHLGEKSQGTPLLCCPILKEEFEWFKKSSFINSKSGWFSFSRMGCNIDSRFTTFSSTALVVKDPSAENIDVSHQTCFSDMAAIEVYKIAFYLLSFLCLQADAAVKRAEELGFVDVAHFPDLPMPDILHGLQDQGIAVVSELCEANRLKQLTPEIIDVCNLLLQITEKCLYLEFCVSQVCGLRPVMGRIEDFSKELKLLFAATKVHAVFEESVKSLKHITSYLYPGLLQTEGCL